MHRDTCTLQNLSFFIKQESCITRNMEIITHFVSYYYMACDGTLIDSE